MKSWRDSTEKSPAHRYDLALTDEYAPRIQQVLLGILDALNVPDLIDRYGSSIMKADGDDERTDLIERIMSGIKAPASSLAALRKLLEQATTEGFATGAHAAAEQLGAHAVSIGGALGEAIVDIAWDKWKPGDTLAVGEVAAGALRTNLAELDITVKGISDTVLDTVGNRIGDGLLAGHSSDQIERSIRDQFEGTAKGEVSTRALRIAHTEVARAQTSASILVFGLSGVTEFDLINSDGACPECVDLAAENPWPIDSDEALVPVHPFCRCANSPVIDSIDPSLIQTRDAEQE